MARKKINRTNTAWEKTTLYLPKGTNKFRDRVKRTEWVHSVQGT